MIDRSFIGKHYPSRVIDVEKGQIRAFCQAIGETRPEHIDEAAAAAAGLPGLLAPPTFAFTLSILAPSSHDAIAELGIEVANVLHGEQAFRHLSPIFSGDVITLHGRIVDIYEKKGGALEFLVIETDAVNSRKELCVQMRQVLVVRHP